MSRNMESKQNLMKQVGNYLIKLGDQLGSGRFGTVYSGYHKTHRVPLAIKQISIKVPSHELENLKIIIEDELDRMKPLFTNEHIVKIIDKAISVNNLYLISEYCEGDSLEMIKNQDLKINEILKIMKQTVETMAFAHAHKTIHRDLKPDNILFHNEIVKISDFGLVDLVEKEETKKKIISKKGCPIYMAPELFYDQQFDEKCDVWSLGIIFYELIYKRLPWNGKSATDLFDNNIQKMKLRFPKNEYDDEGIKDLIGKMLKVERKERISLEDVMEHEVFQRNLKTKKNRKIN